MEIFWRIEIFLNDSKPKSLNLIYNIIPRGQKISILLFGCYKRFLLHFHIWVDQTDKMWIIWPVCSSHFTSFLWDKGISWCTFNLYIELDEYVFMYFVKDCTSSKIFGAFSFPLRTHTNECIDTGQKACYLNIDFECQQIGFFIGQQGNLLKKKVIS